MKVRASRFRIGSVGLKEAVVKRGISLAEVIVAIGISIITILAITALHEAGGKSFVGGKMLTDAEEEALIGLSQLEWLFQRWGVGTPCCSQNCITVRSCGQPDGMEYPPPSSLCITVEEGDPCDDVWFYASVGGMGFVDRLLGPGEVAFMSCRLSTAGNANCYHLRRGGLWAPVDWDYENNPVPPVVAVQGLGEENLDCIDVEGTYNTTADRTVLLLNGQYNGSTVFFLESGDLLISAPMRVHLYCRRNPSDGGRLWLYMRLEEPIEECGRGGRAQPLSPVERFKVSVEGNAVKVSVDYRGSSGGIFTIERIYGR